MLPFVNYLGFEIEMGCKHGTAGLSVGNDAGTMAVSLFARGKGEDMAEPLWDLFPKRPKIIRPAQGHTHLSSGFSLVSPLSTAHPSQFPLFLSSLPPSPPSF